MTRIVPNCLVCFVLLKWWSKVWTLMDLDDVGGDDDYITALFIFPDDQTKTMRINHCRLIGSEAFSHFTEDVFARQEIVVLNDVGKAKIRKCLWWWRRYTSTSYWWTKNVELNDSLRSSSKAESFKHVEDYLPSLRNFILRPVILSAGK